AIALLERGHLAGNADRRRRDVARVHVAVDHLALLPDAAVMIDAEIPADADQPRLEVRAPIERVERLEHLQEDVLRQIFGLLVPADELVRDVEHLAPVLAHDGFPGELIARQAPLNQRLDRLRSFGWIGWQVGRHDDGWVSITRQSIVIGFSRTTQELVCDGVPLSAIARAEGTPAYVYSAALLRQRYRELDDAFGEYPHAIHYAFKANSTRALVSELRAIGSNVDAVSI